MLCRERDELSKPQAILFLFPSAFCSFASGSMARNPHIQTGLAVRRIPFPKSAPLKPQRRVCLILCIYLLNLFLTHLSPGRSRRGHQNPGTDSKVQGMRYHLSVTHLDSILAIEICIANLLQISSQKLIRVEIRFVLSCR